MHWNAPPTKVIGWSPSSTSNTTFLADHPGMVNFFSNWVCSGLGKLSFFGLAPVAPAQIPMDTLSTRPVSISAVSIFLSDAFSAVAHWVHLTSSSSFGASSLQVVLVQLASVHNLSIKPLLENSSGFVPETPPETGSDTEKNSCSIVPPIARKPNKVP